MNVESIEIPRERVSPVAADASSAAKVWAAVVLFAGAVFTIIALSGTPEETGSDADTSGTMIGGLIIAAIVVYIGYRFARNASRATRAGELAKTDPRYRFRLLGNHVIVDDEHGAPHPELSFKINGKLRKALLHVPSASVVA